MIMRKLLLLILILIIYSSCIPKKDLVYFQGDPVRKDSIYKLQDEPYRLQIGDILYIDIKSADPELVALFKNVETQRNTTGIIDEKRVYFSGYSIGRQGNIRIPYVGELNILGYTTREVREKIQNELESYFINKDDVFITVKLAGIRVTILGEVSKPGTLLIYKNQINIIEAIANAGDILVTGNRKNVTVFRKNIDGTKRYEIDLTDISSFDSNNFHVESNDIIYIEPLKQKTWGTGVTGMQSLTAIVTVLTLLTTTLLLIQTFK